MDISNYGKFIVHMRKLRGITQVELADEICSVKEIRRIENGERKPNFFTFERILTRLGIDISKYLYGFINEDDKLFYLETLEIWDCIYEHDYKSAEIKFSKLKQKNYFNTNDLFCYQFSLICESIFLFELSGEPTEALDFAYKALHVTLPKFKLEHIDSRPLVIDEYRILNNIALYHISLGSINAGIDILKRLKISLYQKYISKEQKNNLLPIICYNISKCLGQQKYYDEAISVCDEGIAACRAGKSFKCLGELFYNKACDLYFLNDNINALKNFQDSHDVFSISGEYEKSAIIKKNAIEKYGILITTS